MDRRDFLRRTAKAALAFGAAKVAAVTGGDEIAQAAGLSNAEVITLELRKAVVFSMLPGDMSVADRMKLAHDAGFAGVEVAPTSDAAQVQEMREAAGRVGIEIHSVMFGGWKKPLSSPDPEVADAGCEDLKDAIKCAKDLGAANVLLVPALVDANTRYIDAYERSQKQLRKALPEAEKQGVTVLVENVWNNFLLSPLEFARYVDEFQSPYLQAYFDVGNVVVYGWPEDWIRTLGPRIRKVHLKDFKKGPRQFVNLGDGDVNWPEVRKALGEVGYKGYATAELPGGDEAYLKDVCARMGKVMGIGE